MSKIPKILHMIWIGDDMPPNYFYENNLKWKQLMPDWEFKLWMNNDLNENMIHPNYLSLIDKAHTGAQKADLLRYYIIYHFGGYYVDADVLPKKSLNELQIENFDVVLCHDLEITWEYVAIGFFGAKESHPLFKLILDKMSTINLNTKDIHLETGPAALGKAYFEMKENLNCKILPHWYFYRNQENDIGIDGNIINKDIDEAFGTHTYAATWIKNQNLNSPLLDKIAVICPTRDRLTKAVEAKESWEKANSNHSDFFIVCDSDQIELYKNLDNLIVAPKTNKRGMTDPVNFAANFLAKKYKYVMFIGDDHRFRTSGWDIEFINEFKKIKFGFIYGNDLFQMENLPTACCVSSEIILNLKYMVYPALKHLYVDNYWLTLGRSLNKISYMNNIIIEHVHPAAGKAEMDEAYKSVNDHYTNTMDQLIFNKIDFQKEINKLKQLFN